MDNAATALEAGARSLDLFVRRPALPRVNKFTGIGSQGVVHGFASLPDAWKWRRERARELTIEDVRGAEWRTSARRWRAVAGGRALRVESACLSPLRG